VLTCPGCEATNIDVTENRSGAGLRWHGACLDCGTAWDFDDA